MKQLNKVICAALIGLITVSTGLMSGVNSVNAAPKSNQNFSTPREVIGYLNVNAAKLPPAQVEQTLWELERLWNQAQKNYQGQLNSKKMRTKLAKYRFPDLAQFRNIHDPDVLKLLTDIMADSMRLTHSKQKYSLKINYAVINPRLTRYAPQPTADYFRITARSQNISAAGSLKLTPNELAKRIGEAATFLKNNSEFAKKNTIATIYRKCLAVYLLGTAQTPAFTANKLNRQFLQSYQATATKYKNLPFGQVINEYLDLLKQNKYQKTKQVEDFAKTKAA
jgi:hypothetical protein